MRLIPKSVFKFVRIFDWQHKFPAASMPSYSSTSVRFMQAVSYYSSKMGEYTEAINKGK